MDSQLRSYGWNIVILGAGGAGNVPIPLLHAPRVLEPLAPIAARHDLSFTGSKRRGLRTDALISLAETVANVPALKIRIGDKLDNETEWVQIMRDSVLVYAPAGEGPTSFRMYEALQMGRIPVYVYEHALWLPYLRYADMPGDIPTPHTQPGMNASVPVLDWGRTAVILRGDRVWQWLMLSALGFVRDTDSITAMQHVIGTARETHFTYAGVMSHVDAFVRNPHVSHLHCAPLPAHAYGS